MGFSVNTLKQNRSDRLSKMAQEFENADSSGYKKDERYWQPEADKAGKGEALIRFLPGLGPDDPSFVKLFTHSFKVGERWYIENSRTTLDGEKDPVAEHFWAIRNKHKDKEEAKKKSEKFSRKLYFISNILVIDDPAHPENNGKVFLFRYGKVIYDMIKSMYEPEFAGMDKIDVFDLFEGANFHMRFYKKDGFRKYDKSEFSKSCPIADTEKDIVDLLEGKGYDLRAEVAPNKFKSYEDLEKRFKLVMGEEDAPPQTARRAAQTEDTDTPPWEETLRQSVKDATTSPKPTTTRLPPKPADDDELTAFANMANDD
jgi:hypothetical protein